MLNMLFYIMTVLYIFNNVSFAVKNLKLKKIYRVLFLICIFIYAITGYLLSFAPLNEYYFIGLIAYIALIPTIRTLYNKKTSNVFPYSGYYTLEIGSIMLFLMGFISMGDIKMISLITSLQEAFALSISIFGKYHLFSTFVFFTINSFFIPVIMLFTFMELIHSYQIGLRYQKMDLNDYIDYRTKQMTRRNSAWLIITISMIISIILLYEIDYQNIHGYSYEGNIIFFDVSKFKEILQIVQMILGAFLIPIVLTYLKIDKKGDKTMEIQTLDKFIDDFKKIKEKGWITTHRSGTTAVGKTLEDLLGIKENNIQGPDFGIYEIKAMRIDRNSMMTLLTKSPDPKKSNDKLRKKFGYNSDNYENDKLVLHSTLKVSTDTKIANTGKTLRFEIESKKINENDEMCIVIYSNEGLEEPYWPIDKLKKQIKKKFGNQFIHVLAESRGSKENEEFQYKEAYLLKGIDENKIIELIKEGVVYLDIRIGQYKNGKTHDHGTGFRIKPKDIHRMYNKSEDLLSKKKS